MMDEFWLGVIITLIVGIPVAYVVAILAHMHTPRVVRFLEERKLLKKTKTKQQAVVVFNRIKAFREGTKDKYAYYIVLAGGSVLSGLLASILFNIFFNHVHDIPIGIDDAIILLLATVAVLVAALLLTGIYETARQLERFEDYKKEFEQRWGPIDA